MDLREQFNRHRKDNRFVLGVLGGALLFFATVYYLIQRGRELPPDVVTNKVLLFVLQNVNVLLILAIAFVLFRNLVKVWVERKDPALGSKFRTKLVATYITLSLVPVLVLFAYASELLQGSVENLFRKDVEQVIEYGKAVSQELSRRIQDQNQRAADRIAQRIAPVDLQNPSSRHELGEILQRSLGDESLELLLVFEETEFVHAVIDPRAGAVDLPNPGSAFLLTAIREGNARRILDAPGREQLLLLAASSLRRDGAPSTVVVAGTMLDPGLRTQALVQAHQEYLRSEVQKPDLQAIYVLMFLMITLVILLISSWAGLYLARRVTVPIQALAEGTKRIMAGDLDHRVDVEAGDELGVLVQSFNRMTTELGENKELLERKNSELTQMNVSLDEERGRIRAVLQNVTAGVLSVDHEGKVLTCNEAALEMLRQKESEVLGQTLAGAWQDDERGKLLAVFDYDPLGRTRREAQLRLAGEWRTFAVSASTMFDGAGDITGHVIVLEDLTELIEAKQLATWSEAARRIAHEIKNPLTPIKLAAERMRHRFRQSNGNLDDSVGDTLEDGVTTIVKEVDSMTRMVDEFSRFARMPRPQPSDVDLEDLLQDTLKLYQGVKAGIELDYQLEGDVRTGRFDKEQMRGVLINLIDNAVEASEAPATIRVRSESHNGSILLSVEDSGPGISASDKKKLFQPYFSTKGRGTGLGLAIVHRVVNDHNGTIQVEDNQPHGTVFRIELPQ